MPADDVMLNCKMIKSKFEPELKDFPDDNYPEAAKYCVELMLGGMKLSLGPLPQQQYRYFVWQLYVGLPKFRPSYKAGDVFPSSGNPGM
jgi:hypothetical protein